MSVSRRELLFGRLFGGEKEPEPQKAFYPQAEVNDLLSKARRRAPWERSEAPEPSTTGHKARILVFECLSWFGSSCMSCHERCPVPGAITLDDQLRPTVQVNACTGCGDCVSSCPAPGMAIVIGPEAS